MEEDTMDNTIKLISYNIDGLPESIDLNDLPWILKPITWVYKLFKKTTVIRINDNEDTEGRMKRLACYLYNSDADIIAAQEDFNYHDNIIDVLRDKYIDSEHRGEYDIKHIFSAIDWFGSFPFPRLKADGLNLFTKKSRVLILEEEFSKWNESYGYFSHANDKIGHKGFCRYTVLVDGKYVIDIYNLHMDADFRSEPDNEGDIAARKSQLDQLCNYIINRYREGNNNPCIILGDTNSYTDRQEDIDNIDYFKSMITNEGLFIQEALPTNFFDVDRVFYINNDNASFKLVPWDCYYDLSTDMSDHKPVIVEFTINDKE